MTPSESRALMQRELDEQPAILSNAARALSKVAARIRPVGDRTLWISGCGDSFFAGQALARHFLLHGRDTRPITAADLLFEAPVRPGHIVVGISISGGTRRTAEALRAAQRKGARTIAITLDGESALAQSADDVLALPFTPISRAIPHGLDYHVTLLALAALVDDINADAIGKLFADQTPAILEKARSDVSILAKDARFFFLGGGPALGTANYGAAKLHEAGGLPAWSFEAESFAHGAHFMLRPGDHAVLCGAGGPVDARTAALRPGLERLGVSVSQAFIPADQDALLTALQTALWCQIFCLAIAERHDLNVADPSRGSDAAAVQRDWFGWTSA
jgi:fructoselysine-6-P-deglycase FrlB-like protein